MFSTFWAKPDEELDSLSDAISNSDVISDLITLVDNSAPAATGHQRYFDTASRISATCLNRRLLSAQKSNSQGGIGGRGNTG